MGKIAVSEEIIKQALCTYINKGTRYITKADVEAVNPDKVALSADFIINESCYLFPFSGHFNAVEALMCVNQMLYVTLLGGIEQGFYSFYQSITPQEFNRHRRQVYILEIEKMKFKHQIDNHHFQGKLELEKGHTVGDKIYINCRFGFGNDDKCNSFLGTLKVFIPVLMNKSL